MSPTKSLLIIGGLVLMLGGLSSAREVSERRTIVATFYPIYLALQNIAGGVEGLQVRALTEPGSGCLHDYQLTPRDMALLAKADVMVVNGAGLESFRDSLAGSRPTLKVIDASVGIQMLVDGGITNAHVWVSPGRYIQQVRRIANELAVWDPRHAALYQTNATVYCAKIEVLRTNMMARLHVLRTREMITFHEAFPYFADEFDLKVVGVIEREPGSSPSAAEMAGLIQLVRNRGVKTLFVEPQYPAKVAAAIARETGAGIYILDPVVTGPESPNAYIDIMERNLEALERALR
jgi:zinc transport system substrate-binding protein